METDLSSSRHLGYVNKRNATCGKIVNAGDLNVRRSAVNIFFSLGNRHDRSAVPDHVPRHRTL